MHTAIIIVALDIYSYILRVAISHVMVLTSVVVAEFIVAELVVAELVVAELVVNASLQIMADNKQKN